MFSRYGYKIGNLRVGDVISEIKWEKGESIYVHGKFVINTINTFMSSADDYITLAHVPLESRNDDGQSVYINIGEREVSRKHLV